MKPLFLIASNTFKDAIRQKIVFLMAFVAIVLTLSSNYLLKLDLGHEQLAFIADFTTGALGFFGSVIAIVSVCQLFYSEFDSGTVTTLRSKPIGSIEFVLGKFLGAALLLAVFVAAVGALGCATMIYAENRLNDMPPDILVGRTLELNIPGFFAYAFLQFLKLATIASLAVFICMVSRSIMFAIIVSFMACAVSLMIGSEFSEAGGIAEQVASVFFPSLRVFEASERFMFEAVDIVKFSAAAAYAAIYSLALCALGVWAFSTREI